MSKTVRRWQNQYYIYTKRVKALNAKNHPNKKEQVKKEAI